MCNLPVAVSNSEKIGRAIIHPYHFHKKRPEWTHRAFLPQPGTDRISVIRLTYMGVDFCKAKAKKIAAEGDGKEYRGLAVIVADQIRSIGAEVHDASDDYCGHAEISFGIKVEPHEPPDSEDSKRLTEMTQSMFKLAVY